MIYLRDADSTLFHGDVLAVLPEVPAESVDCVVTSPPYWGLRDYGQEGQLGLELTPEQYVERMVEVFREVRRVLARHGTMWLNLGDSYTASTSGGPAQSDKTTMTGGGTLKPKDLVGIPWRVAFALQADGWYLRSDIIWSKPNPMPESVTDRPTKAHEYLFLLSKQARYFFDQTAVREPPYQGNGGWKYYAGKGITDPRDNRPRFTNTGQPRDGGNSGFSANAIRDYSAGRNIRSVWEIATQPYPEAHFATFPEELARRCIAAGCPEQVCRVCGKALGLTDCACGEDAPILSDRNLASPLGVPWGHGRTGKYRPGIVLDPFMGSGTVAYVARKLGRHAVGIDLSAEYLALAARRLQQQSLFAEAQ